MSPTSYQTAPPRGGAATLPASRTGVHRQDEFVMRVRTSRRRNGETEPRARQADAGAVVVVVGAVVVVVVDDGGGLEPEDGAGAVVEVVDGGGLVPPRSA